MSCFRRPTAVWCVLVAFAACTTVLLAQPASQTHADELTRWLVGGGALAVLGGLVALWRWATGAIVREAVSAALTIHDGDVGAHTAAAEHNHRGMEAKLDALTAAVTALTHTVDTLVAEHRIITGTREGRPIRQCVRATDGDDEIPVVIKKRVPPEGEQP